MLQNYFKIGIRNFHRNKSSFVINVLGLSIGIACSILILLWVTDELSFDRFHKNTNEIYRVVGDDGVAGKMTPSCGPLAEYLKTNFPDVAHATRYMPYSGSPFKYNDKLFNIERGAFADPAFFAIFSFNTLKGNPETALSDISNIIITESMAKKFFENEDPIGKTLLIDGQNPINVAAVIQDPPANSHLQFDFVLNTQILKYVGFPLEDWSNAGFHTFIQVSKNTDIQKLNHQIADVMPKQIPGFNRKLFLQPLTDIHLNTSFAYDFKGLGDKKYLYIFSAIALFLILIACINYINLTTARILKRSREIGLRKVLGSSRFQVIIQFFSESLFIVIISFIIGIILVEILLPLFSQISAKVLSVNYSDPSFFIGMAILLIVLSLLSGSYPAWFLSSVKPADSLKKLFKDGQRGLLFRKILVVVQFSLSIILIFGTSIVYYQLNFIKNKNLGFDRENVLYFDAKGKFLQNYDTMKNELLNQSPILAVTAEDRLLVNSGNGTSNLYWEGKDSKTDLIVEFSFVDYNYFDMLNVEMADGRKFSKEMLTDQTAFVLNQEAVAQMKLKQPVGTRLVLNNIEGKIIGVIKNTNFKSLHQKVTPTVYLSLNNYATLSFTYTGIILVKTAAGKIQATITAIEKIWNDANPTLPFEYHFLDETIDQQYNKENQTAQIVGYFSLIAILISCLGLYGLTVFMIENRTKEIGIRKVMGASVMSVLIIFYHNFTKLILLSNIIACPLAWYVMNKWLQNFAYRIEMNGWIFILAGGIALVIALLTISLQAFKAAATNPVTSLRYE
ncbi:ABC transporter permease [candidate division KSB1 bacterium]|nr:ABC transporter permease [candidate division KSB1 bacterium]